MKNIELAQKIKSEGATALFPIVSDQLMSTTVGNLASNLNTGSLRLNSMASLSENFGNSSHDSTMNILPSSLKSPFDK
jgi:hypothetical protein